MILHGEPVLGLEAAAASLIAPDDVVLNLASGVYGKGFGYWAERYTRSWSRSRCPTTRRSTRPRSRRRFKQRPDIKVVSVVPSRHAVGHHQPGRRDRPHRARRMARCLIVDAVSSFGGMDIHPEDCHADIFVTGPNKCLGGAARPHDDGGQRPRLGAR